MLKYLLICLFVSPLFAQPKIVIINTDVTVNGKEYRESTIIYEFDQKIILSNMKISEATKKAKKMTITGKDKDGKPVQQVFLGKLPDLAELTDGRVTKPIGN